MFYTSKHIFYKPCFFSSEEAFVYEYIPTNRWEYEVTCLRDTVTKGYFLPLLNCPTAVSVDTASFGTRLRTLAFHQLTDLTVLTNTYKSMSARLLYFLLIQCCKKVTEIL